MEKLCIALMFSGGIFGAVYLVKKYKALGRENRNSGHGGEQL